jgi:hypothetical protein
VAKGLVRCRDYLRELGLLDAVDALETKSQPASLRRAGEGGEAE